MKIPAMHFLNFSWLILFLGIFGNVQSLRCFFNEYPLPTNCSLRVHDGYETSPACMTAVILDKYKNPVEIRRCSKTGAADSEIPGDCELLRKKYFVEKCSLCQEDFCNDPNESSQTRVIKALVLLSFAVVLW